MTLKWVGSILILLASGGFGLKTAYAYLQDERTLRQLIGLLDTMTWDLQSNLVPLPTLCRDAALNSHGVLSNIFTKLADELDNQIRPDAYRCMLAAMSKTKSIPKHVSPILEQLGQSLGKFTLAGQISGIESVQGSCIRSLELLNRNRELRLRGYQTLALCAGAALVILFI